MNKAVEVSRKWAGSSWEVGGPSWEFFRHGPLGAKALDKAWEAGWSVEPEDSKSGPCPGPVLSPCADGDRIRLMHPSHNAGLRGSNHLFLQLNLICLQGRSGIEGMYQQSFVGFIHQAGEVAGPGERSRAHRRQGWLYEVRCHIMPSIPPQSSMELLYQETNSSTDSFGLLLLAAVCYFCLEFRLLDLELTSHAFTHVLQVQIQRKSDEFVGRASRRQSTLRESRLQWEHSCKDWAWSSLGMFQPKTPHRHLVSIPTTNLIPTGASSRLCFHLCFTGDVSGGHGPVRWVRFCLSQWTIKLGPGKTFRMEADE